ncbi:cupin domain-containing protein [Paludibacterium paludis]|uniref:Cupin type-2 domain-containing protein n=1 Tax=Paludibacterium paludis TaxID=1225769 RepID=A0A918U8M7_9NEIS|nr:cupin domain-containing protein [Paludibacterium paludis]GGY12075.1 hypothetical protein GCM10011289_13890 [Paludibacterium paludis]
MATTLTLSDRGDHFACAHAGALAQLDRYTFKGYPGKLFLQETLGLTSMEVSLNKLPAGAQMPFSHSHREHEELYVFVRGNGQFQVDGRVIAVGEGTVLRVAPQGERTWRNHSREDLYYIVIQATDGSLTASGIADGVKSAAPVVWPE